MGHTLVSMLVNVGDVIMMTSALELLHRHLAQKGLRLGVLVRPEAAGLLTNNPVADEVIVYPYRSGSIFSGLGELRRKIKAGGYTTFLSLDRRPRGAMAAWLAGVKFRLGPELLFEDSRPTLWGRLVFNQLVPVSRAEAQGNRVELFQQIVRRAFGATGEGQISLPRVRPECLAWARQKFQPRQGPVIGLCVKTNAPAKVWPADNFSALMVRLRRELGACLYVTGGPGEAEYVGQVIEQAGVTSVLNLAGQTTFEELGALTSCSDLYITLDNGAAHVAAHSGTKMICLFLSTDYEKTAGSLAQARIIHLPQPEGGADQVEATRQVEVVFQAARALLAN